MLAKEARRVDVLCLRLSLSQRILLHTKNYQKLQNSVETAIKSLNEELGPLEQVCGKMGRGIVNRLSCGAEVQKLCVSAVESFDSMFSDPCSAHVEKKHQASKFIVIFLFLFLFPVVFKFVTSAVSRLTTASTI